MRRHWPSIVLGIAPFFMTAGLTALHFKTETNNTITIFLSFVWGIMFALGGAIIYLERLVFSGKGSSASARSEVNSSVVGLSFVLILQTLIFIFLSVLYPLRAIFNRCLERFSWIEISFVRSLYDSALCSFILIPSVGSIIIGGWCLAMKVRHTD